MIDNIFKCIQFRCEKFNNFAFFKRKIANKLFFVKNCVNLAAIVRQAFNKGFLFPQVENLRIFIKFKQISNEGDNNAEFLEQKFATKEFYIVCNFPFFIELFKINIQIPKISIITTTVVLDVLS